MQISGIPESEAEISIPDPPARGTVPAEFPTKVSSSSASAAAAAARAATTLGSAIVDDVECCFFGWKWFLWCGVKFCSMKINVGMTPTKIPKVLI